MIKETTPPEYPAHFGRPRLFGDPIPFPRLEEQFEEDQGKNVKTEEADHLKSTFHDKTDLTTRQALEALAEAKIQDVAENSIS